jgi:hypothetical protein
MSAMPEVIGTLDFLPKIGYSGMESYLETLDTAAYMWWGNFVVQTDNPAGLHDETYRVIENLSSDLFIVNMDLGRPIFIQNGYYPAIASEAEMMDPPHGNKWFHFDRAHERALVAHAYMYLKTKCTDVLVLCNINPCLTMRCAIAEKSSDK